MAVTAAYPCFFRLLCYERAYTAVFFSQIGSVEAAHGMTCGYRAQVACFEQPVCLLLYGAHTVKHCDSVFVILIGYSAEKADRLEVYALYHVSVCYEKFHHFPYVVKVDVFNNRRHQCNRKSCSPAVFDCQKLRIKQRLVSHLHIYFIGSAVKLQIYYGSSRVFELLCIALFLCYSSAVGVYLYILKAFVSAHSDYLRQVVSDRRLAAGKLYVEFSFFAQLQQQIIFSLYFRQRHIASRILRLCKAVRAVLVASVCYVYENAAGCLQVVFACAAVERAFSLSAFSYINLWRYVDNRVLCPPYIVLRISRHKSRNLTVFRTFFSYKHFPCFKHIFRLYRLVTYRAYALYF